MIENDKSYAESCILYSKYVYISVIQPKIHMSHDTRFPTMWQKLRHRENVIKVTSLFSALAQTNYLLTYLVAYSVRYLQREMSAV